MNEPRRENRINTCKQAGHEPGAQNRDFLNLLLFVRKHNDFIILRRQFRRRSARESNTLINV